MLLQGFVFIPCIVVAVLLAKRLPDSLLYSVVAWLSAAQQNPAAPSKPQSWNRTALSLRKKLDSHRPQLAGKPKRR
jgi:hypothetical protein